MGVFYDAVSQQKNFEYYSNRVAQATDRKTLSEISQEVLAVQKAESGNFFFAKGNSKVFWDTYKAKKAEIVGVVEAQTASRCKELMASFEKEIKKAKETKTLAAIRQKVLETGEFDHIDHKVPLFAIISEQTAKLSQPKTKAKKSA